MSVPRSKITWLIWGSTGYIGKQILDLLKNGNSFLEQSSEKYICMKSRLENRTDILEEIKNYNNDDIRVLNIAGITGSPNVDWCENHKEETLRTNVIGTLNLADICNTLNIHCTVFSSGCIYNDLISVNVYTEEDKPNFTDSFYSKTKANAEMFLKEYKNILILRIRMPICSDITNTKNFINKILRYKKVVNIPNSMSYLPELLPISIDMSINKLTGIYNFVNEGLISHNEILDLYIKYVDNSFRYENFSIEEQSKILVAPRSNVHLSSEKINSFSKVSNIKILIENLFQNIN